MAKIVAYGRVSGAKKSFFGGLWVLFKHQDKFIKMSVVTMLIILILTPIIITTRQIFFTHAETTTYLAYQGSSTVFSISNITPTDINIDNATIRWTTLTPTRTKITYWEDNFFSNLMANFTAPTIEDNYYTTNHIITLPSGILKPDTNYKYKLHVSDESGEQFDSPVYPLHISSN